MAQIQYSTKKQRPRANFLLGCFGCSGSPHKVKENAPEKISSGGRLKLGISWLSSSQKSPKKAPAEKLDQKRKESFRMVRLSQKFSTNQLAQQNAPADGSSQLSQIPAAVGSDEAVHGKANKKREEKSQKKINLENGKSVNHSDSIPKETSTLKKGVSRRNSWSQPTSAPEDKDEVSRQVTAALPHSASLPPASAGGYRAASGGAAEEGYSEEQDQQGENDTWAAGKFDQLVGMSIIVVTLLIMIIWGKVCAILCTSAWLYFYPLLLRASRQNDLHQPNPKHMMMMMMMRNNGTKTKSSGLDIDSQKHKKKVVFEGFLERNHRVN